MYNYAMSSVDTHIFKAFLMYNSGYLAKYYLVSVGISGRLPKVDWLSNVESGLNANTISPLE